MELAHLIHQYLPACKNKYTNRLLPGHFAAIAALLRCRTPDAGQIQLRCTDCPERLQYPRSCGHRSCPRCQNHEASLWLDRQRAKLLPVEYFMVTFTLPYELRALTWRHQTVIYNTLFAAASSTLKDFGLNPKTAGSRNRADRRAAYAHPTSGLSPPFTCHRAWWRGGSGKKAMEKEKGKISVQ